MDLSKNFCFDTTPESNVSKKKKKNKITFKKEKKFDPSTVAYLLLIQPTDLLFVYLSTYHRIG